MNPPEEKYLKKIEELEEENQQLRHSADSFGRLAERLNDQLIQERRRGLDRRREPRDSHDRRSPQPR